MIDNHEINSDAPVLRLASRRHRILAFFATSVAAFLLISLSWPLNMQGYRCEALIEFDSQVEGSALVETQLPSVLRTVMEPAAMSRRLDQLDSTVARSSRLLSPENIEAISRRVSVGFRDSMGSSAAQLRVVFAGTGQPDEAEFTRSLASEIAGRLAVAAEPDGDLGSSVAGRHRRLDQAHWLVDQIEEGVASAKNQTAELVQFSQSANHASAFKSVGHVRRINHPTIDSLHQTLESVDIHSLRGVINQMDESRTTSDVGPVRFDPQRVDSRPVGAVPDSASLMLASLVSLFMGGVVAWNVRPFTETGFDNVDQVANQLGVPVVATLASDPSLTTPAATSVDPGWANRVFRGSGTVIVAITVLGAGFWLTSPAVRQSFGESMFHGFARIVWIFTGA